MNMQQIKKAIGIFQTTYKRLPETLNELISPPPDLSGIYIPLLDRIPKDAWGGEIHYIKESPERYYLISYGMDGKQGGTGTIRILL